LQTVDEGGGVACSSKNSWSPEADDILGEAGLGIPASTSACRDSKEEQEISEITTEGFLGGREKENKL
jgi:hypothetical protein